VISTLVSDGNNHFCDINAEHCYLNFPDDMVEDNVLDLENIKEKKDENHDLYQSLTKHPIDSVMRTLMMSTTYCATPNQVTMQPIGKGSTKCTLPGIISYKLYTYFFHVFCMYSVLLSTDFTYSRIPGDQAEPIFFRQDFFLAVILRTNWCTTNCIT
jgi:hypothetical protein